MNITVINGSPKGKYSITLQTVRYLEKKFTQHKFEILHVGQQIRSFEKDFSKAEEVLKNADLILFSYPVYTFLVPSQMHRFIELMKEHKLDLSGKFVTQISTSKHFYDVTAHRFVEDNCMDMKMKFIQGLSADMDDLLTEKGQKQAVDFLQYVLWCMEKNSFEPVRDSVSHNVISENDITENHSKDEIGGRETTKEDINNKEITSKESNKPQAEKSGDIVIVADYTEDNTSLKNMIIRFQEILPLKSRIVNLREYPFQGGCLGCFNCATSGKCVYKDGFDTFLREQIQSADAIVFAFSIKDHSMGSLFKMYDDRQFCNGHRTVTMGMPMGYLVRGKYSEEPNLQMVIEARAQVGGNFLAGVATDEHDTEGTILRLSDTLVYALKQKIEMPQNFYGVGGMKIFRDLIYQMQGMMKADHAFYKAHHQYDFPQKKKGTILKMYAVGALLSSPKIKSKMGNKMNEGMIMPYQKVIDQA